MTVASCKKNEPAVTNTIEKKAEKTAFEESLRDIVTISRLGFDPMGVKRIPEGYLVEGDIMLTRAHLEEANSILSKQQGQYVIPYTVKINPLLAVRKIKIATDPSITATNLKSALNLSIVELNSMKVSLDFVLETDTTKADIILRIGDPGAAAIARGIFGDALGNPGKYITITSDSDFLSSKSVEYLKGVLNHEIGHTIGLRHTDYKFTLYSELIYRAILPTPEIQKLYVTYLVKAAADTHYGANTWDSVWTGENEYKRQMCIDDYMKNNYNEETFVTPNKIANHIYGTPVSPTYLGGEVSDPESLMLAVGPYYVNKYSLYDNVALFSLYGNSSQKTMIKNSLGENGNITASGKTLQQVVDATRALKR